MSEWRHFLHLFNDKLIRHVMNGVDSYKGADIYESDYKKITTIRSGIYKMNW